MSSEEESSGLSTSSGDVNGPAIPVSYYSESDEDQEEVAEIFMDEDLHPPKQPTRVKTVFEYIDLLELRGEMDVEIVAETRTMNNLATTTLEKLGKTWPPLQVGTTRAVHVVDDITAVHLVEQTGTSERGASLESVRSHGEDRWRRGTHLHNSRLLPREGLPRSLQHGCHNEDK